jgi:exopolysaccharide biosynthesis polyprenyl glycosylphosphotransferase
MPPINPMPISDLEGLVSTRDLPAVSSSRRRFIVRRALLAADFVALAAAFVAAGEAGPGDQTVSQFGVHLLVFLPALLVWFVGALATGLYDRDDQRPDHSTVDDFSRVLQLATLASWCALGTASLVSPRHDVRAAFLFWLLSLVAVLAFRVIARSAIRHHPAYLQNTIIVGAGEVGQLVGRKLLQHPEFRIRVIGFVDSEPKTMRGDLEQLPIIGSPADIIEIVRRHDVQRVIVAFSNDRHDLLLRLVRSLRDSDVQIDLVPRLFEAVGPAVGLHVLEGLTLVGLNPARSSRLARKTKRLIDAAVAAFVLLLTAPLFLLIAWRIKFDSPGPILFRQERLGEGQVPFALLKFRTMAEHTDPEPHREYVRGIMDISALPAENNLYKLSRPRDITPAGAWLRRTSLDELPQLINVLRGDMSLVGPRPCIAYETELYEPHHFDRFLVPAGMTGLWQVAARAHATFREALDLDAAYARGWSLRLDLWLLARTPPVLVRGRETS